MPSAITSSGGGTTLTDSASLRAALSDETGTGAAVFANTPTLVTPVLGTPSSGVATNLTGTAAGLTAGNVTTNANLTGHVISTGNAAVLGSFTIAQLNTAISDADAAGLGTVNTFTAAQINSTSGAASVPAMKYSGVPFAGTGTTSFPLFYINDANATASTTLSTAGTYLGINGDGTQDLINALKDGTSAFKVTSVGGIVATGSITGVTSIGASQQVSVSAGNAQIYGPADKVIRLSNSAGSGPTRINFTNDSNSFSAITGDLVNSLTLTSAAGTTTYNDPATAGSGTVANRYLFGIAAPTLTATNATTVNTVASTVYIGGAPTASTNVSVTTPYALNVAAGVSNFGGVVVMKGYTVATLPSTAATGKVQGARAFVTDALAPSFLVTVVGGGSAVTPVFYDGTNWVAE